MTAATLPPTGNTAATRPENRAFYPALDGLRAVAFLMVFFQHYAAMAWGWSGVDLFFVLSGFLITGILYDSRDDAHRARNFYVRRTLRIFPLYYAVMIVIVLLTPVTHFQWSALWLTWPLYLGNFAHFVHPYVLGDATQRAADAQPLGSFAGHRVLLYLGHFWSLCIEEQFYLLWPGVVFAVRSRRLLLWICAGMLPVCLLARLVAQHTLPGWMLTGEVLYRATPFRLDALLLGGALALALRGPHARTLLRAAYGAAAAFAVALVVWAVLSPSGRLWHRGPAYTYPGWKFTWGLTLVDLLAATLILLALQPGSFVYRVLNVKALRWMGRISYGAYVFHDIPHLMYGRLAAKIAPAHSGPMTSAVALPATFALAWLSFRLLETPFLNLKEKWTLRGARTA